MRFGILGTGSVGQAIGSKLCSLGYDVRMGARSASNEKAAAWAKRNPDKATFGTYADAAAFGEILFHCTQGASAIEALRAAGEGNLGNKVLVDVSNPLDFSKGGPPTLFVSNTDSLGEQIQRAFPQVRVVKALNTVTAEVMVNPSGIGEGEHAVFVCGNDTTAKAQVTSLLSEGFGWRQVLDLGDISSARGTESYLLLWLRLWGALGTPNFNVRIVR